MTKIYYNKNFFIGSENGITETIFCMPFEKKENWPDEPLHNNRFNMVLETGNKLIEFSSLKTCDYAVLPYKYNNSFQTKKLIQEANGMGKKIIVLYNDDNEESLNLDPEQTIVFKTSLSSNKKNPNEYPFPAFVGDFYSQSKILTTENEQMTVGFCGQALIPIRKSAIKKLREQTILKPNFILRKGFWAPEISKNKARAEFIENMRNNLFHLCVRGAGNFSYRFYETMMMGRIPIIIDTNQVFPFEKIINYKESSLIVKAEDINNIEEHILNFLTIHKSHLIDLQSFNRQLWEKYLSPTGWLRNFKNEII